MEVEEELIRQAAGGNRENHAEGFSELSWGLKVGIVYLFSHLLVIVVRLQGEPEEVRGKSSAILRGCWIIFVDIVWHRLGRSKIELGALWDMFRISWIISMVKNATHQQNHF